MPSCKYVYEYGTHRGKRCGETQLLEDGFCSLHSPNNESWRNIKSLRRLLEKSVQKGMPLQGANLRGVDLRMAHLAGADLQGADLTGCNFYRARMPRANLSHAKMKGVDFSGANLRQATLAMVLADESTFHDANLTGANLEGAHLIKASFENAVCTGTRFRKSMLLFARFLNASLEATDFRQSNLTHASFDSAHLLRVEFAGANLDSINYDALTVRSELKNLEKSISPPKSWAVHLKQSRRNLEPPIHTRRNITPDQQQVATVRRTPPARPATHLLPGDSFGDDERYKILKKLGQGGMALVYLVKDRRDPQTRYKAIKILDPAMKNDQVNITRFKREGRIIQNVRHQNVIRIYDISFSRQFETHYLVMEYIDGTDLDRLMERFAEKERTLLNSLGAHVALQLCDGLAYTHSQNIVHRDLKPGNILMRKNRDIVISDFGLSKFSENVEDTLHLTTVPGTILGTFDYMAPEQLNGDRITERTDIYSLGVILYEMFTARRPYTASTITAWIKTITQYVPQAPQTLNPKVPGWLSEIIMTCLEKRSENRFPSVERLKAALKAKGFE